MKFTFVILHYNKKTVPDTLECLESIKSLDRSSETQIVVVENGSDDGSLELLHNTLKNRKNITLLEAGKNLGFACGNNLGCSYALKHWQPDFLIVINNDTVIHQRDFLSRIEDLYGEYSFHILGPNIIDRNGNPQNPVGTFPSTPEELDLGIKGMDRKWQILQKSCFLYWLRFTAVKQIKKKVKILLGSMGLKKLAGSASKVSVLSKEIHEGIGLHGAALIFSSEYLKLYDDVFYPGTFMFKEEDILYYRVKAHGLTSLYHPDIKIHHKEDQSTDSSMKNGCTKERFIVKNQLDSFKAFRSYMEQDKAEK